MITAKPRRGEILTYERSEHPPIVGTVYLVDGVDGNICKTFDLELRRVSSFIWSFHDGLNKRFSHTGWGALALHTGYRTGNFYLDDYLGDLAGLKAFRAFEAKAGRGMGAADERRYRSTTKYFADRGAARDNAKAAELQAVLAQRKAAGLQGT